MISDSTYHAIWDGLLEVSRCRRYYELCELKYQRLASAVRIALAISGIGVLASLLEIFVFLPTNTISLFGMLILVLIVLDLAINPSKIGAQLIIVNSMLSDLEDRYRNLWEEAKAGLIADSEALGRKSEFMQELTRVCSFVDISVDDRLSKKAQTEAFQTEEARYAGVEYSGTSTAR